MGETSPEKTMTVQEMLLDFGRRIFGREVMLLLVFGGIVVAATLYGMKAYAEDVQKHVDAGVLPLAADLAQHKHDESARVGQLEQRMHAVEISTLETSMNVQLLVRAAHLEPIALPRPLLAVDGGAP